MVGRAEFARGPQCYQADSNYMLTHFIERPLPDKFLTKFVKLLPLGAAVNIVARYLIAQMALSSGMMDEGFGA